jgi:hypothetical protein
MYCVLENQRVTLTCCTKTFVQNWYRAVMTSPQKREGAADLLRLSSQLWDELAASRMPATTNELWQEHLHIRQLLAQMNEINPPKPMFQHVSWLCCLCLITIFQRRKRIQEVPAFVEWLKDVGVEFSNLAIVNESNIGMCCIYLQFVHVN